MDSMQILQLWDFSEPVCKALSNRYVIARITTCKKMYCDEDDSLLHMPLLSGWAPQAYSFDTLMSLDVWLHHSQRWCTGRTAGQDGKPGLGRVLTDGTCSGLRRIHLSGLMLKDHLTDRYSSAILQLDLQCRMYLHIMPCCIVIKLPAWVKSLLDC